MTQDNFDFKDVTGAIDRVIGGVKEVQQGGGIKANVEVSFSPSVYIIFAVLIIAILVNTFKK